MDHTACALDALEGVVGLEHVAQRLQALHLAAIADLVLGQAEDRNAIASRGDDVFVQKARLDHTATKSKHSQAPDAGDSRVDLEHLSKVDGALSLQVVIIETVGSECICILFRALWGDDVFVTKASTLGT